MFSRSMLKTLLFASILLAAVTVSFAAAPADQATQAPAASIHTYLMPDLSLKSALSVPLTEPLSQGLRKTCRCSCGTAPCATDADCGGGAGSCSHFISCCAKSGAAHLFSGTAEASRQTALPAFKSECK